MVTNLVAGLLARRSEFIITFILLPDALKGGGLWQGFSLYVPVKA